MNISELQDKLDELEDKEIDAIRYGRLDLLQAIREEAQNLQDQIHENSSCL